MYSKIDALRKGLSGETKFFRKDLWKYDISKYDNIVIFGVEQMVSKNYYYINSFVNCDSLDDWFGKEDPKRM